MSTRITYRQVIEFTVEVNEEEQELDYWDDIDRSRDEANDLRAIFTEVVKREHVIDWCLNCDNEKELYMLLADGEVVYQHSSHDMVVLRYEYLTGEKLFGTSKFFLYDDLDRPEHSWNVIKSKH